MGCNASSADASPFEDKGNTEDNDDEDEVATCPSGTLNDEDAVRIAKVFETEASSPRPFDGFSFDMGGGGMADADDMLVLRTGGPESRLDDACGVEDS